MKTWVKIDNILSSIDAFGKPVNLRINEKSVFKSFVGGILTLCTLCIVLGVTIYEVFILITHSYCTSNTQTLYQLNPPFIDFQSFMFSIGHKGVTLNQSMFSMTLWYVQRELQQDGTIASNNDSVPLVPCNVSQFFINSDIDQERIKEQFIKLGMSNHLCPENISNNYSSVGDSSTSYWSYLQVLVTPCDNNTTPHQTCATPANIQNYIATAESIEINVNVLNSASNVQVYSEPADYYIQRVWFLISPGALVFDTDLNLRKETMNTVSNFFGIGDGENVTTLFYASDKDERVYHSQVYQPYLTLQIRSSHFQTVTSRIYLTLGGILGVIGGVWNVLYLVLGFLAGMFAEKKLYLVIAERINEINMIASKDDSNDDEISPPIPVKAKEGSLSKKLTIDDSNFHQLMANIFKANKYKCFWKINSREKSVFNRAMKHASATLDILNIIEQVELFKRKKKKENQIQPETNSFIKTNNYIIEKGNDNENGREIELSKMELDIPVVARSQRSSAYKEVRNWDAPDGQTKRSEMVDLHQNNDAEVMALPTDQRRKESTDSENIL